MDYKRIMKQPDLGKKIVELRKAKGLTQEELVSICNLNVRTLQRIEAGEVTPRSYTIKTIFSALDFDVHVVQGPGLVQESPGRRLSQWLEQLIWYSSDLFNLRTNTMKKISILTVITTVIGFSLVAVFSDGRAQSSSKVKKVIEENNKHFMQWYNHGQVDSLVALYADDACLVARGCGKEFIRQYYGIQTQLGYTFRELESQEVSVGKSLAVEKGRFVLVLNTGMEVRGEYITEWKLVNREWRIASDMAGTSELNPGTN